VPENTLAYVVGVLLTTFGIFWGAEGAGVTWPGGDAALPGVLAFVLLLSFGYITALRRRKLVPA
jgi:MYXO-CTERM domain-containing protein